MPAQSRDLPLTKLTFTQKSAKAHGTALLDGNHFPD